LFLFFHGKKLRVVITIAALVKKKVSFPSIFLNLLKWMAAGQTGRYQHVQGLVELEV
jgi:hypothetical protein